MLKHLILLFFSLFTIYSFSQDELIIKFKKLPFEINNVDEKWNYFKETYQIKNINLISSSLNIWKVSLKDTVNKNELKKQLKLNPLVELIQENKRIYNRTNIPNDPEFNLQWQHINQIPGGIETYDMDSDLAWDITTGGLTSKGKEIVICIIDDGVDIDHEDLVDNLWINKEEIPNNNIDDDNNGYIDDIHGYNFWDFNNNVEGDLSSSHGTAVAGLAGATGNNNIGVSGVNWEVKLMHLVNGTDIASAIEAYDYALNLKKKYLETNGEQGAFIVATNSSWGSDRESPNDFPIWCAMYDSLGKYGILNAVATSNSIYDVDLFGDMPSSCPSNYLIAATNINQKGELKGAFGKTNIDLGAPGSATKSTLRNNNYGAIGGTSSASPLVAGAIALAYSTDCDAIDNLSMNYPDSLARIIKNHIIETTKPIASIEENTLSQGLLNINNLNRSIEFNCDNLIVTSIDNTKPKILSGINVFPNPTNGIINISINNSENLGYSIININGKIIKKGNIFRKEVKIDLTNLEKGIYILNILKKGISIHNQKVIKI